ncbi:MAG TPA: hypothetical protein VNT55_10735 [Baekduia sp.]|nr:hypothetical protein [Baekduia sp.]
MTAGPAGGAAARDRCPRKADETAVRAWKDLTITRGPAPGLATYACTRATGRRTRLDDNTSAAGGPWVRAGAWLGYSDRALGPDGYAVADQAAYNIRTGAFREPFPEQRGLDVTTMVLKPNGAFAVAGRLGADRQRVYRYDRDGYTLLGSYAMTTAVPLTLRGGTLTWTVNGKRHRARLR